MKPSSRAVKAFRRVQRPIIGAVIALAGTAIPVSSFASAQALPHHLSLSTVTINVPGTPGSSGEVWIALAQKYFKKLGLNVSWQNANSSATDAEAVLISGGVQFLLDSLPAELLAVQEGASFKGLLMTQQGNTSEIAVNAGFAAAHGIPTNGNSTAKAIAQMKALKGTHITIAISNLASSSYIQLYAICLEYGISLGTSSSDDVQLSATGSPANEVAALNSGKTNAEINVPPVTTQPDTIKIPIWRIPPLSLAANDYLVATTSFIKQHPDTVQAMTTAIAEAMQFAHSHQAKAQTEIQAVETTLSAVADPTADAEIFQHAWLQPYPTKQAFQNIVHLTDLTAPNELTAPYSSFMITKYAVVALKKLGMPIPKVA